MTSANLENILHQAEKQCANNGTRLTHKRKHILKILAASDAPLSAYEIADHYREQRSQNIPVMSVYRMLDFLANNNLVHKLSSTNKYIACAHIACNHAHEVPQFLICDNCHQVREVSINRELISALQESLGNVEFQLNSPQLELHGLCEHCR